MTLLALVAGDTRYGLDVREVEGVIPLPRLRPIPLTPPWVAGVFEFFERLVPVIDLCLLHGSRPARRQLATRVVVASYRTADGSTRPLGLMAERVTDIIETEEPPKPSGVAHDGAPWLGGLVPDGEAGLVQILNPADLLTDEVRAALFAQ